MAHDDQPLSQPLGARRAHEILADHLEQARARHPRDVGALSEAEDDGGADDDLKVLPGILPQVHDHDRRLVTEPEQRGEHDQHAEPEAGDRDEEDRQRAREAVGQAVGLERAQDADGQADEPGDDQREHADLSADRSTMRNQLGHGVAAEEGLAEATGRDVPQPVHVLHRQRVAEAEVGHDAYAVGRRHARMAFDAEDGHQRVAGENTQDDEDAERHAEQCDERVHCSARQVLPHRSTSG